VHIELKQTLGGISILEEVTLQFRVKDSLGRRTGRLKRWRIPGGRTDNCQ